MSSLVEDERIHSCFKADWKWFTRGSKMDSSAAVDDAPLNQDQILEVVRLKYDFVSGSARNMFELNVQDLRLWHGI